MSNAEGELMDLNQRIRTLEQIVKEFAEGELSNHVEDSPEKLMEIVEEMEQARQELDEDFESHSLQSFLRDAEMLDELDQVLDKHLIQDLREIASYLEQQAEAIDKEVKDLASRAQN